jgi:hypothetical protein
MPAKRPATPEEHRAIRDALLSRFSWPVEEEFMREAFEVVTDHERRRHVVLWPRESLNREPAFGRYLHEMAHALLAEQVHPQFSRPFFTRGIDPALKNTYSPLVETALDWFVQALLMEVAPGPQGDDIDERYRQTAAVLRQGGALPSVEFVIDSGMALASFRHYRGLEIDTQGKLRDVVEAFLRTPPDKPTLFTLHGLVRRLMDIFGMHTAHLVHERGFERWRLDPVKRG